MLKHIVLIFCLDYLTQKEKPWFCIDTHAGAGSYPLLEGFAAKNREWEKGVAKLSGIKGRQIPAALTRYLELTDPEGISYPGSPEIIRRLLRKDDRACCFELHPEDFVALKTLLGGDRRFSLRHEDGFAGLRGLLPPPSRRGLIFIDPVYEVKDDYALLPQVLSDALKRFSTGTYIIWHPLLHRDPRPRESVSFQETLLGLYDGSRLGIELYTAPKDSPPENAGGEPHPAGSVGNSPRGMYGSGLVIFNPPWTLKNALEETLPFLGLTMGIGKDGWFLCNHEAP